MKTEVSVSVIMITYNHSAYIEDAINGVLFQKCNFNIELIIANDRSTDDTDNVIKGVLSKSVIPNYITVNYSNHDINKGMNQNYIWALNKAQGKYIANCEGDDYWTDPLKLQKQVDFMEANPEYAICFHEVAVYNQNKKSFEADVITREVTDTTTVQELSKGNFMHTPSVLYRNDFNIPKWFWKVPTGDWALYMILIKDRKIKKIPEKMAVYRKHGEGIWSGKNRLERMKVTKKTFTLVLKNIPLDSVSKVNLSEIIQNINKGMRREHKLNLKWKKRLKDKLRPFYHYLIKSKS